MIPQVRIVIQSRLTSARLPGKALLPLGGLPSVVLCAKRAANKGLEVLVATSSHSSDDANAEVITNAGISCVRGPLENVLKRFELATRDLSDNAIVVRLTADNVFPDGLFIKDIVQEFCKRKAEYLATKSPFDGLPYGLSAEVFSVKALRRAVSEAQSHFDKEHVTPWIVRTLGSGEPFRPEGLGEDLSHLRCTMDNFEDYKRLLTIFSHTDNPIAVSWQELCHRLSELPQEPRFRVPYRVLDDRIHSEMTLGTVQLGLPYGAANVTGQPPESEAVDIVNEAIRHGVTHLDCAQAYGNAENIVGKALSIKLREPITIITKLAPLTELESDTKPFLLQKAVEASVFSSCHALGVQKLDVLMLHRWNHYSDFGGEIWRHLLSLKHNGVIQNLGVSVQTPKEALEALQEPEIRYIQLPFNLLDWRWKNAGLPEAFSKRSDVIVHARSALLQGILCAAPERWPQLGNVSAGQVRHWTNTMSELAAHFGRDDVKDLCFAYVRAQPWVSSVVVGVETRAQLDENMALFRNPPLSSEEATMVEETLTGAPENLLNPACWSQP
jgi:aryl-alcohol dehydrogenase-like predicted oxidoreductase/spore coat polysaccharide biosynthesis protein SpsF (cytidylyltransferase family)